MRVSTPPDLPIRDFPARVHLMRFGIAVALAVLTFLLFPAAPAVNFPVLEVGAVATENVIAPFAFDVPKSSSELEAERTELARMVTPTLRFSQAAYDSSLAELAALNEALSGLDAEEATSDAVVAAAARAGLRLTNEEAEYLLPPTRRASMLEAVDESYR